MAMLAAGHCWRGCGGALVSVFWGVFAGGGGGTGRWAIILWGLDTLQISLKLFGNSLGNLYIPCL